MFAIIGAVLFALALLLQISDANVGDTINPATLQLAGLLCLALHLAGVGVGTPLPWRGRRRTSLRR